jgi:hypothetical protein
MEHGHVLAPIVGEAAQAIEELEIRRRDGGRSRRGGGLSVLNERRHVGSLRAGELLGQRAAPTGQHHSRYRLEHVALRSRHAVGTHEIHASLGSGFVVRARRLAHADEGHQRCLEIFRVGRRTFVQNHQIDGEQLHPPVLVRAEELPREPHVLRVVHFDQNDRKIPRNPVGPQRLGTAHLTRKGVRRGS